MTESHCLIVATHLSFVFLGVSNILYYDSVLYVKRTNNFVVMFRKV